MLWRLIGVWAALARSTAHSPISRQSTLHFLVVAGASTTGGAAGGIGSGTALEIGGSDRS